MALSVHHGNAKNILVAIFRVFIFLHLPQPLCSMKCSFNFLLDLAVIGAWESYLTGTTTPAPLSQMLKVMRHSRLNLRCSSLARFTVHLLYTAPWILDTDSSSLFFITILLAPITIVNTTTIFFHRISVRQGGHAFVNHSLKIDLLFRVSSPILLIKIHT